MSNINASVLNQNSPTTFHPHGIGFSSSPGKGLGRKSGSYPPVALLASGTNHLLIHCTQDECDSTFKAG
jgi:hypothetical protein